MKTLLLFCGLLLSGCSGMLGYTDEFGISLPIVEIRCEKSIRYCKDPGACEETFSWYITTERITQEIDCP